MTPLDSMVSVINHRLKAQQSLVVTAQLYDITSKLCWEKRITTDVPANSYKGVFDVPPITQSGMRSVVHFVRLQLKDKRGAVVSNNFYWLPSRHNITQLSRQEDLIALEELPPVTVRASMTTQAEGAETVARVKLENPGKQLAFFVHAAITRASDGEEILPVLWSDNYISLAPGEVRELTARFATADAGQGQPALEVGGWNVESQFKCVKLRPSKSRVKAGEAFTVTASIADTFLDGSRVPLLVDGQPADAKWAWARGSKRTEVNFTLALPKAGEHRLDVGDRSVTVKTE
jgi:hypothetical protein